MKAVVVTTITSTLDIETRQSEHSVEISDEDGLSEVSGDILGALVMGGLISTRKAIEEKYPRVAQIGAKKDEEGDDQ